MSNVLARVLILINLRGVKLRVGLGRGVRYYIELQIKVQVGVRVRAGVGAALRHEAAQLCPVRIFTRASPRSLAS